MPIMPETSLEMPMMVPSHFLKGYEYYITSYYRPELAFRVLENTLGKELFLKCLQEYIHRWKEKYSSPYDLFFTFNDVSKQDLTWFWKPWYFEMAAPDLGIQSYRKEKDGYLIDIDNIGGLPLPIELNIEFADGTKNRILKTADVWKTNKILHQIQLKTEKQIRNIRLGANWIPDSNYSNNQK
jgi:aminopeptidase N